jgi:hypothetical protein
MACTVVSAMRHSQPVALTLLVSGYWLSHCGDRDTHHSI